jgi:putative spermidine/putrescine transport system permease protein
MASASERPDPRPLAWRLLDGLEAVRAAAWPAGLAPLTPYLLLLPAVLLVGLLAVGLGQLASFSLHELDPDTYRLKEAYSLANYAEIGARPVYLWIALRSLGAALIVTALCLLLGFPYAYLMVRTPRPALRKLLLVGLFLPFFVGQVVRAYGWLIVLGQAGLANQLLGLAGLGPLKLLYHYPAVLLGLVQYMLPFAVLLLAPAIVAIDEEAELASASLGATWPATLRHVVLPMAMPGLAGAGIVVFTITLTDYALPEILGGGTNDFIANAIYDAFFQISDAGLGSALAVVLVLLGSAIVALLLAWVGAGTLGFLRERSS